MKKSDKNKYNPSEIEAKWQEIWEKEGIYKPDLDNAKKPFYNLMMFPYPSAEGMHVGNMYAFTGSDIYGRLKRMQGYDVFEPIGLDGFGIHSENYAIKVGRHPMQQAEISQNNFYRQLRSIGNGFDWDRTVETYEPNYYKWTQWIFIQLFKAGLAYRKKSPVNFCPSCKTVLADEQVIDGRCERCSSVVEKKELEQWFFRITKYADRLLKNTYSLDWSEKVRIAQQQWIGKKEGINIRYNIKDSKQIVEVFTTRPDTNFGATFIALAPEHPLALKVTTAENKVAVGKYIKEVQNKSEQDRIAEGRDKTGIFTGSYAINNLTNKPMPIWVSDFVLMGFGTGAVVGVPGHDKRDFEFAKKFGLPIPRVVVGSDGDTSEITNIDQVQELDGTMINSEFLDGINIHDATQKIMDYLEEKGWGKREVTYHLRDWLISRQRYWGAPIPMIYCEKCEWQPVPEDQLPVLLPDIKDWRPVGTGKSPLANHPEFYETTCPNCGGKAQRETDVSDTFLDSSWYFYRYISTEVKNEPWGKSRAKKWLPVTMYIGGAEHSVLHLLYSRFLAMAFKDMGFIDFEEPFTTFRAHGLIIKDGAKMSKSKGNVVVPDEYINKFGSDTLRTYLMFTGPFQQGGDFRDSGIEGMFRFVKRVWTLFTNNSKFKIPSISAGRQNSKLDNESLYIMHKIIKGVTEDLENLRYNTAIAKLMEWYNFLAKKESVSREETEIYLKLLAPFAPHVTEELFQSVILSDRMGVEGSSTPKKWKSIHTQEWPSYDEKYLVSDEVTVVIQVNGKMRDSVVVSSDDAKDQSKVEKVVESSEKVEKYLKGQKVKKVIYVPCKIINFVV